MVCRKRTDEKGKTLRTGIIKKNGVSYQVEVRPRHWRDKWKLHFGTYATEGEAQVARDFCTYLRVPNEGESKAGGYYFSESKKIFGEFNRAQYHQVCDLFRKVCDKCANNLPNSTHSAGAVSPGKSKSSVSKDPDLKLLNEKARDGIKEMMGKFKELYPSEFETSTGISEIFIDEAETRGNQVQTIHPSYTGAPSLRDIIPKELLTDGVWNKLGELLKIKGDEYVLSSIRYHSHRDQGPASSLHRELDSDPQVAGNYPLSSNKSLQTLPSTSQGRTPDSAVDWTNGEPSIPPSSSVGICFSTSLVQQQFLAEVEQRDHNGYHNPQECTLFPAQQKLSNQAFPYLDEVMKVPLPTAHMDPKGIDVIDSETVFDSSDDFVDSLLDSPPWDYTKELD
jgi:hypothetical protein